MKLALLLAMLLSLPAYAGGIQVLPEPQGLGIFSALSRIVGVPTGFNDDGGIVYLAESTMLSPASQECKFFNSLGQFQDIESHLCQSLIKNLTEAGIPVNSHTGYLDVEFLMCESNIVNGKIKYHCEAWSTN